MDINSTIKKCIEECESIAREIEKSCQVPNGCLGGEMLFAYEKIRESQLAAIKNICNQLRVL